MIPVRAIRPSSPRGGELHRPRRDRPPPDPARSPLRRDSRSLGDWDLLLRLTESDHPSPLPVVASIYTTSAPDRISAGGHHEAADAAIRMRSMAQRPLRVLAYNSLFPLVPKTYIPDEMRAYRQRRSSGLVHRPLVTLAGPSGGADLYRPRCRCPPSTRPAGGVLGDVRRPAPGPSGSRRQTLCPPGPLVRLRPPGHRSGQGPPVVCRRVGLSPSCSPHRRCPRPGSPAADRDDFPDRLGSGPSSCRPRRDYPRRTGPSWWLPSPSWPTRGWTAAS